MTSQRICAKLLLLWLPITSGGNSIDKDHLRLFPDCGNFPEQKVKVENQKSYISLKANLTFV